MYISNSWWYCCLACGGQVKTFHDMEAKVVGHDSGKGRLGDRLGALEVELANGKRFRVGSGFSDAERMNPPKIGSIITFKYQELSTGGIPRFPTFLRIRPDAIWPPKP